MNRLTAAALATAIAPAALASFHLMLIDEIFTSPDGRVQYVELRATSNGQTNLDTTRLVFLDAGGANAVTYDVTADLPALNNNETWLVATPCFERFAGFAPDYTMAPGTRLYMTNGRVIFQNDAGNTTPDAVAYGAYTGANAPFGSPAEPLPADGTNALRRVSTTNPDNNLNNFDPGANNPRRNDGMTIVLDLRPCPGDTNGDRNVDFADINNILSEYNQTGPCPAGDLNGDTVVDFGDLNIALGNYNAVCP